jgi:hypothetical protein
VTRFAIVIFLSSAAVLQASGFEDMILWSYDLPGDSAGVLSLEPSRVCRNGVEAVFLYCQPYSIRDMGWNTALASYGFGRLGFCGLFSSYGYREYYTKDVYSGGAAFRIMDRLHASGTIVYNHEEFLGVGSFGETRSGVEASYKSGRLAAVLGLSDIKVTSGYNRPNGPFLRPWAGISYSIDDGIDLAASVKRTDNARTRWLFQQQISLSRVVDLHIGLMNRPNVIYGGIDLSWRSITLLVTYYSVGRLNDTVVLGLAAGT